MTVFCRDCKHREGVDLSTATCMLAPRETDTNYLVSGEVNSSYRAYYYCSTERGANGHCTPEGKLFEPILKEVA